MRLGDDRIGNLSFNVRRTIVALSLLSFVLAGRRHRGQHCALVARLRISPTPGHSSGTWRTAIRDGAGRL